MWNIPPIFPVHIEPSRKREGDDLRVVNGAHNTTAIAHKAVGARKESLSTGRRSERETSSVRVGESDCPLIRSTSTPDTDESLALEKAGSVSLFLSLSEIFMVRCESQQRQ